MPSAARSDSLDGVPPRLCPRCEQPLPSEADGSLLFCPACGAPQVRVSEQLLEEAAQRRHTELENAALEAAAGRENGGRNLLHTAGIVGGVAALLGAVSMLLPAASLLLWFWAVGAPVAALGLHLARHRETLPDAGFGARLGFLSGVAVALALTLVNTVSALLARFALHRGGQLDAALGGIFAQMRATAEAQHDAVGAAPFLRMLSIPEFRAGLLLASMALFLSGYVALAMAGGAFAGFLRRRTAQS